MKHLLFIGFFLIMINKSNAQDHKEERFQTYSQDSTTHFFLGIQNIASDQTMPNPFLNVDMGKLENHPMVKNPLEIVDSPEYKRPKGWEGTPEGFKYDFQDTEKFKNELNFNPKFRK